MTEKFSNVFWIFHVATQKRKSQKDQRNRENWTMKAIPENMIENNLLNMENIKEKQDQDAD